MLFNNSVFGKMTQPFKESPYIQAFEKAGSPLPPPETYFVIDYLSNFVVTYTGDNVVHKVA